MPAKRVTALTLPVDPRSAVAFESYRDRTPLLTIMAVHPALLVTLTLPEHLEAGHVRFARDLARQPRGMPSKSSAPGTACRNSPPSPAIRREGHGPGQ
jgi:hypothetical protein